VRTVRLGDGRHTALVNRARQSARSIGEPVTIYAAVTTGDLRSTHDPTPAADPAPKADGPLVVVIILNWNQWRKTLECVEGVRRSTYANRLTLVVDNGSEDGSAREIAGWIASRPAAEQDRVSLITSQHNLGFAGGANLGTERALALDARYVLFLNNDARITPDTVSRLVETAERANAAFVGAVVLDSTGSRLRFARRHWPWMVFGFTKGGIPARGSWWTTAYADGSAFLARADVLRARHAARGHYFDPRLFMYWEEVDLCRDGLARGYTCVVARAALVYHDPGGSSGGMGNPRSAYYVTRNRIVIANRWLPLPWKIAFHIYYVPSRLVLQLVRAGRVSCSTMAAVGAGLIDGYLGRGGKWSRHGRPVQRSSESRAS
jgi:GT2 family glycosyltransferase